MQVIDSHAHLQEDLFPGKIDSVVQSSKEAGVIAIVNIGTSLRESQEMVDLAVKYPNYLFPTVGLHPHDAADDFKQYNPVALKQKLLELGQIPGVVAIGECGLDYGKADTPVSDLEKKHQREIFEMQVAVAQELKLPFVVHCRNAWEDVFSSLLHYHSSTVILHSFTGDEAVVIEANKRGYFISFSGIVTFSNAKDIQKAATMVPIDKILVETDSPYLAPVPLRGQGNEPKNVLHTLAFLATLRNEDENHLAVKTVENTKKIYNLPL